MTRTICCSVAVRYLIRGGEYGRRQFIGSMTVDGRKIADDGELLEVLMQCLADGVEFIPLGERCDQWDDAAGCRGHLEGDAT